MYKYYLIRHNNKQYKVRAENEDAAVAKLKIVLENKDQELFTTNVDDGFGDIAKILGGIAVTALEGKKMLQSSSTPPISESIMKSMAVIGTDILAMGAEVANLAKKNLK